jgi:hypothetical protein
MTLKTLSSVKDASSVHDIFVSRPHPQHADVVAIRKTASAEEDHLETSMISTSSGINTTNRHEVAYFG